ncbi:hypothetical protein [Winogradskya humida]|uniref:Uncharacterized protein n=1 Tax=Winogradskya humida TaxID=113566 RepID=A0ABQ4A1J8_9ACTN|nr:hypothetical protein [Actinoplanes humidus]GIE24724.1 hypothetical protein Ahu01nite_078260 [Actinoplanes humidus]
MNENDFRAALRDTMTLSPPPPMDSATAVGAGRRSVRRRNSAVGAGAAAVLVAATALAVNPGIWLSSENAPAAPAAAVPSVLASPAAAGDKTEPAWPTDGDGKPQTDATSRSGPRYEKGKALLAGLLAVVPDGWTAPTGNVGEDDDAIPLQYHQAAVDDIKKDIWTYSANAAVAKDGRTGQLAVEVHTANSGLPQDPCQLAKSLWGLGGNCTVVTVGGLKVGTATPGPGDGGPEQWAAYRHPDGVAVFVMQQRTATNGSDNPPALKDLPLPVAGLAALAVDERFHVTDN